MTKTDVFLNTLKQAGYRITAQRRLLCAHLAETDTHPTASDVFETLAHDHPDISRATVYNTLNTLQELGALTEISFGDGHTHYETDTSPHVNLICLRCHKIMDYHADPIALQADAQANVTETTGFHPVAVKTEMYGFCADCRQRKREEICERWQSQRSGSAAGAQTNWQETRQ